MKNLLLFVITVGIVMVSCASMDEYKIRGKVNGMDKGVVYITIRTNKAVDTLARAEIKDGSFEMRGSCSGVIPAIFEIEGGTMGNVEIYLENKSYEVELEPQHMMMSKINGGGEAQKVANEYAEIGFVCNKAISEVRDEFMAVSRDPQNPRFTELRSYIDSLLEASNQERAVFIKEHTDSYVALYNVALTAQRFNTLEELEGAFNVFTPEMKNTYCGEIITERIETLKTLAVNQPAPDFTVQAPDGNPFTLYSVQSKVKLIDFWASWCGPCRAMVPQLIEFYQEFHDKGLEIVSVSFDDNKEAWVKAIVDEKMPWVQGSDLKGYAEDTPLVKLYGIFGIPHLVVLDKDNRIVARNVRGKELHEVLAKLLN